MRFNISSQGPFNLQIGADMSTRRPSTYYYLKGRTPVATENLQEWARWMQQSDHIRNVAVTKIGDIIISTLFLGIDHRFYGSGPPILFETMVFGGSRNEITFRYSSWDDAEAGHAAEVKRVKAARDKMSST